jgi:hypothetical protein
MRRLIQLAFFLLTSGISSGICETLQTTIYNLDCPLIVHPGSGKKSFRYKPPKRDSENRIHVFTCRSSPLPKKDKNPDTPIPGSTKTRDFSYECTELSWAVEAERIPLADGSGFEYIMHDSSVDSIRLRLPCGR